MNDDSVLILEMAEEKMTKAIHHLEDALLSVRAGKASQHVLRGIMVEYYGTATPIEQVASVNVPDAKTILIQPWEKNMIGPIEKAILDSNIGLTPSNNGELTSSRMSFISIASLRLLYAKTDNVATITFLEKSNAQPINESLCCCQVRTHIFVFY